MDGATISIVFGVAAGIVQLAGYWIYNREAGHAINSGSWGIWAVAGIIDLVSYFAITGDWVVNILPAVCAAAAIGTFCYALMRKRFTWPDKIDWVFVGADGVVTVIWFFTNAVFANLLYQATAVSSFWPMYRGLLSGRETEKALPWIIWTVAYGLLTVSVLLRFQRWEELAYPLTHLVMHLAVALIALNKLRNSGLKRS